MEEMTVSHRAAIQELRDMHNITMATLHEEHARTMRGIIILEWNKFDSGTAVNNINPLLNVGADLRKAHEQQKILLEEDFEKLRLSLQVFVRIYKKIIFLTHREHSFVSAVSARSGSSGHAHISKPESERQSQALWGGFEEKHRWTDYRE